MRWPNSSVCKPRWITRLPELERLRKADSMSPSTMVLEKTPRTAPSPPDSRLALRVRPIMRQGTASSIPETWEHYGTLESARAAVKRTYHDDRVLRVFIVTDDVPPRFVEWVER